MYAEWISTQRQATAPQSSRKNLLILHISHKTYVTASTPRIRLSRCHIALPDAASRARVSLFNIAAVIFGMRELPAEPGQRSPTSVARPKPTLDVEAIQDETAPVKVCLRCVEASARCRWRVPLFICACTLRLVLRVVSLLECGGTVSC